MHAGPSHFAREPLVYAFVAVVVCSTALPSSTVNPPYILFGYTKIDTVVKLGQGISEVILFQSIFFLYSLIMGLYYFHNEKIANKNK